MYIDIYFYKNKKYIYTSITSYYYYIWLQPITKRTPNTKN